MLPARGLLNVLGSSEWEDGSCAVVRGSLDVIRNGLETEKSSQRPTVTIADRPDEAMADRTECLLRILGATIVRIDESAKQLCVVTGCGVLCARKVFEMLLRNSGKTAVVVNALD